MVPVCRCVPKDSKLEFRDGYRTKITTKTIITILQHWSDKDENEYSKDQNLKIIKQYNDDEKDGFGNYQIEIGQRISCGGQSRCAGWRLARYSTRNPTTKKEVSCFPCLVLRLKENMSYEELKQSDLYKDIVGGGEGLQIIQCVNGLFNIASDDDAM